MNYRRILVAGLLAGLLITVSEYVLYGLVLADRWHAVMARLGLAYPSWSMPAFVVWCLVCGVVLSWLYAAIRPRYGPGARTAAIAAAALWLMAYMMPTAGLMAMVPEPVGWYVVAMAWGAAELLIASLLAGYLYREASVSTGAMAK